MDTPFQIDDFEIEDIRQIVDIVENTTRSVPFVVLHYREDPMHPDNITHPMIALANTPTGGILIFSSPTTYVGSSKQKPINAGFDEYVEDAEKCIRPVVPKFKAFRDDDIAAVAVESVVRRIGFCYDAYLGDRDGIFVHDGEYTREAKGIALEAVLDRVGISDAELYTLPIDPQSALDTDVLSSAGLAIGDTDALRAENIISDNGDVTLAGALAFGNKALVVRFPALAIAIRRYPGGAEESIARDTEATAETMVAPSAAFGTGSLAKELSQWLPVGDRDQNGVALFRELLANAAGHRTLALETFDDPNDAIVVSVSNDQVRITNPGATPRGRVKLSDRDRLHGRFSRNPNLMLLLEKVSLARQKGLGLAKVRSIAPRVGCRLELVDHIDSLEARVVVDPDYAVRVEQFGSVSAPSRKRMQPEERQQRIIEVLGADEMSAQALAAALQWPIPTVRAALNTMVKKKLLRRCSKSARSPRQRYRAR